MSYWKEIAIAIALPETIGFLGTFKSRETMRTWYKGLRKPSFNPPTWVFGPVWCTLYAGMGYASFLVWRDGGGFDGVASKALQTYGLNLVFNGIWAPLFFNAKRIDLAAIDILLIWGSIVRSIQLFTPINNTAGKLLWPYLAWASFASVVNLSIWYMNRDQPAIKKD